MLGWHFCEEDKKLGYGNGSVIVVGETLKVEPPVVLCDRGLHACISVFDAVSWARSPIACRVRIGGQIAYGCDKFVGSERTVIAMADASMEFHAYACDQIMVRLPELHPHDTYEAMLEAKLAWLAGTMSREAYDDRYMAAHSLRSGSLFNIALGINAMSAAQAAIRLCLYRLRSAQFCNADDYDCAVKGEAGILEARLLKLLGVTRGQTQ